MVNMLKSMVKGGKEEDREVDLTMRSDDQSKMFTYKKCIRMIKLNTANNQPLKLMFD